MKLKNVFKIIAFIVIILSVLPFVPADYWWIRVFDFPHLQLTSLTVIAFLIYLIRFDIKSKQDYAIIISLLVCIVFQFGKIYPYTFLSGYELKNAKATVKDRLSLFTANVLQDNKESKELFTSIAKRDPDLILLTETNERWRIVVSKELQDTYQYSVEAPFENTYGMMLFSKYKLIDKEVLFLIEDTIPSIFSKVITQSKDTVQLYAIHPAPPTPQHNPSSVDRDAELMKVAKFSRESKFPVVVMGDFNDVAWSETTKLFQKFSGLLDMRKGRGFFNTYNAHNILLRWPLDHIFVSTEFRVIKVERGEHIGSDHFPFYTELSYEPNLAKEQKLPPPSEEEISSAMNQIENENEQKE